jgi:hypothetical protein
MRRIITNPIIGRKWECFLVYLMSIFQPKSVIQRPHSENNGGYLLGYDLEIKGRGLFEKKLRVFGWNY